MVDLRGYNDLLTDVLTSARSEKTCDRDEFNCGDGQCVPTPFICNRVYDCSNGADELHWSVELAIGVILPL